MSDPRARRGVRHRLRTILGVAVCAVLAGATSYAAIAEWAADLPPAVRLRLGVGRGRPPSESAIRRCLQRILCRPRCYAAVSASLLVDAQVRVRVSA